MAGKRGRVPRPYKTKDGRWRAAVEIDGKRRYLSGNTELEVQRELTALLAARDAGTIKPDPSRQTLAAFLDDWLADDIAITVPHYGTRENYRFAAARLTRHLGHVRIGELTTREVQRAYREMAAELRPNTIRNIHAALRRALDTAVAWQLILTNPATAAKPPPKRRQPIHPLTLDEARRILDLTSTDQYHALWALLLTTGLRIGQAAALTWADIDTEAGSLSVHRTIRAKTDDGNHFGPPKSKKPRALTLDPALCRTLRSHRAAQHTQQLRRGPSWNPHRLAFCNSRGHILFPGQALAVWRRTLARLGIDPRRTHETRHTAATLMLSQGARLDVVAQKLGHASAAFTADTYGHPTPAEHAETTNRLAAALRAKPDPLAANHAATEGSEIVEAAQ